MCNLKVWRHKWLLKPSFRTPGAFSIFKSTDKDWRHHLVKLSAALIIIYKKHEKNVQYVNCEIKTLLHLYRSATSEEVIYIVACTFRTFAGKKKRTDGSPPRVSKL